jgi:hypothetical protein
VSPLERWHQTVLVRVADAEQVEFHAVQAEDWNAYVHDPYCGEVSLTGSLLIPAVVQLLSATAWPPSLERMHVAVRVRVAVVEQLLDHALHEL